MGSILDAKNKFLSSKKHILKTKGDRLGWEPLDSVKSSKLNHSVGNGEVVNGQYSVTSYLPKLIP